MTASFLAAWWVQSLVLAGVLAATAALLQWIARDTIPARAIWGTALLGATAFTLSAPMRMMPAPAPTAAMELEGAPLSSAAPLESRGFDIADVAEGVRRLLDAPTQLASDAARGFGDGVPRLLLGIWLASAAVLALVLVAGYRRLRRVLHDAPSQLIADVRVRLTEELGPAVVGVRAPLIVVPRWLLRLPNAEQALVVRHEQSHVAAGDPLLLMMGVLLAAMQAWNPFTWLMLSRLRLAIELDCDRRLLRSGSTPRAYGDLLIALAAAASPASRPAALHPMFSHHRSHLAQRIIAMTERPVRFITARRLTAALLAGVALVAACESKLPTDAEVASMDAASAVKTVAGVAAIDQATVRYFVDGKPATQADAKAIPADRITSVSVQNGLAEIHITTGTRVRPLARRVQTAPLTVPGQEWSLSADTVRLIAPDRSLPTDSSVKVRTGNDFMKDFSGVLILDGVRVDASRFTELTGYDIGSVSVFKGAAATKLYGPDAQTGAIVVTTKKRP